MVVARYAPQVTVQVGLFHRECFEAWYFGRHGARPRLRMLDPGGHQYTLRGASDVATASL
jgi:hypothetical protein